MRSAAILALLTLATPATTTTPLPKETTPVVETSREVNITSGSPVDLGGGVTVDVKDVGYMHIEGSANVSHATLILKKGAETKVLPMGRNHGEGSTAPHSAEAFGWTFILEHANPYQQPSSVQVMATPPAR